MSNGFISLQQAIDMTTRYRQNKNAVIDPAYSSNDILSICNTFNKADIEALVAKPECAAIRLYFGMNEDLQVRPMLVAVDSNDNDILPPDASDAGEIGEFIADNTVICPPFCPNPSVLN